MENIQTKDSTPVGIYYFIDRYRQTLPVPIRENLLENCSILMQPHSSMNAVFLSVPIYIIPLIYKSYYLSISIFY